MEAVGSQGRFIRKAVTKAEPVFLKALRHRGASPKGALPMQGVTNNEELNQGSGSEAKRIQRKCDGRTDKA